MGPSVHSLIPRYRRLKGEEKLNDDHGLYTNDSHNTDLTLVTLHSPIMFDENEFVYYSLLIDFH